jgi:xanthine dehydrogenase YagS FAD-binding subunit
MPLLLSCDFSPDILGGYACYVAYPSDLAPALTALNARVEIASPKGNRVVPIGQFYVGPQKNILRENILAPREMLVVSIL